MRTTTEQFSWFGSGWIAEHGGAHAWQLFGLGLGVGLLIILVSYCFTLVSISPLKRAVLCLLRFAVWCGLFYILAAPTRIVRTYDRPTKPVRPLAVLVDRSDSMTAPDNRNQRRVDDALSQWRRIEPAATKSFSAITAFAFAEGSARVESPSDPGHLQGGRTDLFETVQTALTQAPTGGWGGIVVLTDGLDTSNVDRTEARRATIRAAIAAGTPLYFIVGRNRGMEPDYFRLREFNVPPKTAPHSVIRLTAAFESYQGKVTTIPVQLGDNGNLRPAGSVRLEAGRQLSTWRAEGSAASPGRILFEIHAGDEMARAEVTVEPPPSNRVLFRQGAIDWGYRFLADALRNNKTLELIPLFALSGPDIALAPGSLIRAPTAKEINAFGIILLDHVSAAQLPAAEQLMLTQWVKDGGVLVFVAPDDAALAQFAGSELEQILPVVAVRPSATALANNSAPVRADAEPARVTPPPLVPFVWENTTRVKEFLDDSGGVALLEQTPRFASYARIERAKPGAEILARHPDQKGPDGRGAVLLAIQRYGRGKTVAFTTDALWRWRLGATNAMRGSELFWGNFLAWLNRDREPAFYFDHPPVHAPVEQELTVRLAGAKDKVVQVTATLDGRNVPLAEVPLDESARGFRWTPPSTGLWQIEAHDETTKARMWVTIDPPTKKNLELPAPAPDEQLLRSLAEQTSGSILGDAPASWSQKNLPAQLLSERRQPVWHRSILFGALLAAYGLEMLLRRRWSLL